MQKVVISVNKDNLIDGQTLVYDATSNILIGSTPSGSSGSFVPYLGATSDVDLGIYEIKALTATFGSYITSYYDWFLPSLDEMITIDTELYDYGVGGFTLGYEFWTSTEYDATQSFAFIFGSTGSYSSKSKENYVRPVRSFTSSTSYNLRDVGPASGWIFYKNDNGSDYTYYETSPVNLTGQFIWSNIELLLDTTTASFGFGLTNSVEIITQKNHATSSAKECIDYIFPETLSPILSVIDENGDIPLLISRDGNLDLSDDIRLGFGSGNLYTGTSSIFIGKNAGCSNIIGYDNIFIGEESGLISTGYSNVFIGYQSGFLSENKACNNIFIGDNAGYSNNNPDSVLIGHNSGRLNNGRGNTFIGAFSGTNNTSSTDGVFIGEYSGHCSTSTLGDNVFIGRCSGYCSTGGKGEGRNTFIGSLSGLQTSGSDNTFIGHMAGYTSSCGDNVFIGRESGYSNIGCSNTFVGNFTGYCNAGYSNVFIGHRAGSSNTDGSCNVFIGRESGCSNMTGINNVSIGSKSLCGNTAGNNNIAIGTDTLRNVCGNGNVGIGQQALSENRFGDGNFALGFNTLSANLCGCYNIGIGLSNLGGLSGSNNIALGYCAGGYSDIGSNNIFIGVGTGTYNQVSNNVFIGHNSGNCNLFGCYNTHVGYQSGIIGSQSFNNTYLGYESGMISTGDGNTFIGSCAGVNNTVGAYNTFIGFKSGPTQSGITSSISLGSFAVPQNDFEFVIGSLEYPILTSSTYSTPISGTSSLVIRINGTAYKIPLYE